MTLIVALSRCCGGGVSERALAGPPCVPRRRVRTTMKKILCLILLASACAAEPTSNTDRATQGVRCQNCGGDGGGVTYDVASAEINAFATTTYGDVAKWGLSCDLSADGASIASCDLWVAYGGGQIRISCTYPADGGDPVCVSAWITPPS